MEVSTRKIAGYYRRRWHRDYVHHKLRLDPSFARLARLLDGNPLPLLDVGCGMGLLGFYLHECGFRGDYLGVDADETKVAEAQRIADTHPGHDRLTFMAGPAQQLPAFSGNVALLDVLHYLDAQDQQQLLHDCAARLAPGGMLAIRNVLRENNWRYRLTVMEEKFCHALRWMRTGAQYFPTRTDLKRPLQAAGLTVEVSPLWGRTPFNSYLLVARREPAAAETEREPPGSASYPDLR